MQIAFYKGTRPGLAGVYSWGVRRMTKGAYSHVECVFSNGECASSSYVDGGVRFKEIKFDPENWDFITIPTGMKLEPFAMTWFLNHDGEDYDLWGNVHFVIPLIGDDKDTHSCAEAVACALGLKDGWRYSPNTLYNALKAFIYFYELGLAAQNDTIMPETI